MPTKFIADREILYSTRIILLWIQKKVVWEIYGNSFGYGLGTKKIGHKKSIVNGYLKEIDLENKSVKRIDRKSNIRVEVGNRNDHRVEKNWWV